MNTRNNESGFVLVTSLIFLVVVTLLAVAAINRSTLQEKIATNTRARETAQQHANAALRAGEAVLATDAFDAYLPPNDGTPVDLVEDTQAGIPDSIHIWYEENIPIASTGGAKVQKAENYLIDTVWDDDAQGPVKYKDTNGNVLARYYIEELAGCYQTNLNPDACATGSGVVMYRITARATEGTATVVTQSTFAKYY